MSQRSGGSSERTSSNSHNRDDRDYCDDRGDQRNRTSSNQDNRDTSRGRDDHHRESSYRDSSHSQHRAQSSSSQRQSSGSHQGYQGYHDSAQFNNFASITPGTFSVKCGRPKCPQPDLPPGTELYVIHDKNNPSLGLSVCHNCKLYYDNRGSGITAHRKDDRTGRVTSWFSFKAQLKSFIALPPSNAHNIPQIRKANALANRGQFVTLPKER